MAGFEIQKSSKKKRHEGTTQTSGDALGKIAIYHHTRGDLKNAEKNYRKAISTGCSDHAVFLNLGVICKNSGRPEEAIFLYLKAIELSPIHPDAYLNLAPYTELGNLDQALASTLKSLELKPDNPTAHMNLGRIHKRLGNLDQALASTLKSLEFSPDNPDVHMNLGGIYKDLGNLDQALASTLKSLELKPDNPTAHMNLGGIYKDLGNLDQALASTLKSLELKPDNPDALINLGCIYQDLGQLNQALTSTLKSLELNPDNPTAHMNLGGIYKDLERIEDATQAFNQVLSLTTKDTKHLTTILDFYDNMNNEELLEKSIAYLKSALPSPSLRIEMYEARVLFRQKKYEDSWAKLPTLDLASKDFSDWFSMAKYHALRAQIAKKTINMMMHFIALKPRK